MPNIAEMKSSKYLTKHEVGEGMLVTITGVEKQNMAAAGQPREDRWVLLTEGNKPFVLNSTNTKRIAKITGSDETDDWEGKQVVLYFDENIEFGGEIVGGIRARAPKGQAARAQTAPSAPKQDFQAGPSYGEEPPF